MSQSYESSKIDKTKWEKKGITRIHYAQDGNTKTYVFDDFKFERVKMGEILAQIENGLQDGKTQTQIAKDAVDDKNKNMASNETQPQPVKQPTIEAK